MSGSINGVDVSLLLDTGAVFTLLRDNTWLRVTANKPQHWRPWSSISLVSTGGTTLTVRGCATVELELKGKKYSTEIVVVSPLTSEGILGLDFFYQQNAVIDLAERRWTRYPTW